MKNFFFETDGFQDPQETLDKNFNGIGGFALVNLLRNRLKDGGLICEDIFDEDYGWGFYASTADTRYFVSGSVDSNDDGISEFVSFANVNIEKDRKIVDMLFGRNKLTDDDPAILIVKEALETHVDVVDLKAAG